MGSVYDIRVEAIQNNQIDLHISLIHLYLGAIDEGKTFALSLLGDPIRFWPFTPFNKQQSIKEAPLFREMGEEECVSEDWMAQNAQGFIEDVEILTESYEEDSITCTMRITVTHPGWLSHMRVGMSWDTAAYGWEDGISWEGRPKRRPGDHVEEVSDDPMEGMHIRQDDEKTREMLEGIDATEFVLASHGAKQYTIKDKLEGDTLTMDAVRALAGQPVLVQGNYHLEVGTVFAIQKDGYFQTYHESESSAGSSGYRITDIEYMGRAWFVHRTHIDDIDI